MSYAHNSNPKYSNSIITQSNSKDFWIYDILVGTVKAIVRIGSTPTRRNKILSFPRTLRSALPCYMRDTTWNS